MDAFEKFSSILRLEQLDFPLQATCKYVHTTCLSTLKEPLYCNKSGFRFWGNSFLTFQLSRMKLLGSCNIYTTLG
jgi:hypothetical protein